MACLPIVDSANLSQSLFAPAGGGGGGGPVINVSTINFGDAGGGIGVIDVTAVGAINIENAITTAIGDIEIRTNDNTRYGSVSNYINVVSPAGVTNLLVGARDDGVGILDSPSSLTINASSLMITAPTSLSSLVVSSINGAAPGGAPISVFSTASISSLSVSSINGAAPGGAPISEFSTASISSLSVSSINGAPVLNSAFPKMSSIGLGGGGVQTQYFISTGATAQFTTAFDVEQGHYYSLDVNFVLTAPGPQFTDFATLDVPGVNVNTVQKVIPLYPSTQTQASIKFIGTGAGQTYGLFSTEFASSTELNLNSAIDNVVLTDYGFITTSF